jgi:hypothetical protein
VPTDLRLARAAYEAFSHGQVERLAEWFDPEIEWIEPPELRNGKATRITVYQRPEDARRG